MLPAEATILIVDDEPELRDAITFDFKRRGFRVLTAGCGEEAIKILEANKVDLILSDVRMPNGDGLSILKYVKGQNVFSPVVMFITGFADISLEEAFDLGAEAVFSKPFDRAVLMEAVTRAIQPMPEKFQRKGSRVPTNMTVGLSFLGKTTAVIGKIKNIGRGGFFVEIASELPLVRQEVDFRIETSIEGIAEIAGMGVVRWAREKSDESAASGCGIEFVNLDESCHKKVIEMINFLKTRSFIPKNR